MCLLSLKHSSLYNDINTQWTFSRWVPMLALLFLPVSPICNWTPWFCSSSWHPEGSGGWIDGLDSLADSHQNLALKKWKTVFSAANLLLRIIWIDNFDWSKRTGCERTLSTPIFKKGRSKTSKDQRPERRQRMVCLRHGCNRLVVAGVFSTRCPPISLAQSCSWVTSRLGCWEREVCPMKCEYFDVKAIMTKSALLRKKILSVIPKVHWGRALVEQRLPPVGHWWFMISSGITVPNTLIYFGDLSQSIHVSQRAWDYCCGIAVYYGNELWKPH